MQIFRNATIGGLTVNELAKMNYLFMLMLNEICIYIERKKNYSALSKNLGSELCRYVFTYFGLLAITLYNSLHR